MKSANVLGDTNIVREDGGRFGPTRFDGFLYDGANKIYIQAKNCFGTSKSEVVSFNFSPVPSGARFRLLGLDIIQDNSTPRFDNNPVAGKTTMVRALPKC